MTEYGLLESETRNLIDEKLEEVDRAIQNKNWQLKGVGNMRVLRLRRQFSFVTDPFYLLASLDGLGFEQPRIVVECKHRNGSMGSQGIRSFLGGRHKDDKGLYVSSGGFNKDAKYEVERASIPVTLMAMNSLVDSLVENYENFDAETRALLPLAKLYWPV